MDTRRRLSIRLLLPALLAAGLLPAAHAAQGEAVPAPAPAALAPLEPYTARFAVEYRGLGVGTSEMSLRQEAPAGTGGGEPRFTFTTRSTPKGLATLVVPGVVVQRTTFAVDAGGLRPLSYSMDDGSKRTGRDVRLAFDWERHRVSGVAEDQRVDLPLAAGTQDALTLGLQVKWLLMQQRTPGTMVMVEKDKAKEYRYVFERRERLETALGPVDTVVWRSERPGSNRVTRTWYAPSMAYLPVRAEQLKDGSLQMAFSVLSYRPGR